MVKKLQALKAKKGFTLVELIVVIAIIGVLAAILVPTMMNVVTKSRVSSADQTAKSIKDSVTNWIADLESNRGSVSQGVITLAVTAPAPGASGGPTVAVTATSGTYTRAGKDAIPLLKSEFETNYPFQGGEAAIINIGADRHVKGVAYSDDGATLTGFTETVFAAGTFTWKSASQEGIDGDGKIVGTNPKLLYA